MHFSYHKTPINTLSTRFNTTSVKVHKYDKASKSLKQGLNKRFHDFSKTKLKTTFTINLIGVICFAESVCLQINRVRKNSTRIIIWTLDLWEKIYTRNSGEK